MLIWLCALHCEAKPIIDYYGLQKEPHARPFDWYRNDHMLCVVSGIGKLAAATATASTAEKLGQEQSLAWLNLGIAGAADVPIGTALLVNKCTDMDTGTPFYPAIIGQPALPTRACITVPVATEDYHQTSLYDMEASGFFHAALYYSSSELVHSIKVVSDNRVHQTGKNRQQVSQLIATSMESINQQAQQLDALNQQLTSRQLNSQVIGLFTAEAHYSTTRKHQLSHLLHYLSNRHFDTRSLLDDCRGQSAAQVISRLEQLARADSRNL